MNGVPSDAAIVELYFARDETAIDQTRVKYGKLYMSVAQAILGVKEDAEECLNDTLFRLWTSIPPSRPVSLSAFGCRIARNLSLDRLDKEHAYKRQCDLCEELNEAATEAVFTDRFEEERISECIDAFLRELDRDDRILFIRRYFYGESYAELSGHFAYSGAKIKTKLHRLRLKLKKYLEKEGISL